MPVSKINSFIFSPKSISFMGAVQKIFDKFPHLPKKLSLLISKIMPWLTIAGGLLWAVYVISEVLIGLISLLAFDLAVVGPIVVNVLVAIFNSYLMISAFKPLRKNLIKGWVYLFWVVMFNSIISIFELFTTSSTILTALVATIIGFYLIFEIEEFYVVENTTPQI